MPKLAKNSPSVLILLGSKSDLPLIEGALPLTKRLGIQATTIVASAHRSPEKVAELAKNAEKKYGVIIAGAGMAAHLAGVVAAHTTLPVIGLPIDGSSLKGLDSLYSTVMMPPGIPVATVAINGAKNALILAAQILATAHPPIRSHLKQLKKEMATTGSL